MFRVDHVFKGGFLCDDYTILRPPDVGQDLVGFELIAESRSPRPHGIPRLSNSVVGKSISSTHTQPLEASLTFRGEPPSRPGHLEPHGLSNGNLAACIHGGRGIRLIGD